MNDGDPILPEATRVDRGTSETPASASASAPIVDVAIVDVATGEPVGGIESQLRLARVLKNLLGDGAGPQAPVAIGRYRITRRLGHGAMGVVYAGHDEALDREVGIKVLQSGVAQSDAARRRLIREAQAMARLSHPNVAHVYEVGEHEGHVYIAMELIAGQTLRQWQAEADRSALEILAIHIQAGRGLAAAHDMGIVHRDYKPDNVMIDAHGHARVMDFGLARRDADADAALIQTAAEQRVLESNRPIAPGDQTTVGTVMGTPAYMGPEQLMGQRVDHRADQFSFCVALHEALFGVRPFGGTTMRALYDEIQAQRLQSAIERPRDLPRGVEAVLCRGLATDPDGRHASMTALLSALEALCGAPRSGGGPRRWLAVGAITAAVGTAVAGAMLREAADTTPPPSSPTLPEPTAADPWANILAGSNLPEPLASPLPDDPAQVTVHRLRNGLTVYLAPKANAAMVQAAVVVRADATDETPRQAAVASLLASVLDDGEQLGSADPEAERPALERLHASLDALEGMGDLSSATGQLAAAQVMEALAADRAFEIPDEAGSLGYDLGMSARHPTWGSGSAFTQSFPRNRLAAWASLTAETLTRPAFRGFVDRLRFVVEYLGAQNGDALSAEVVRLLGEQTGWTLGSAAQLRATIAVPFRPMREFWRDYYRPNNTALVLVGEVTAAETLPILEAAFGHWTPQAVPPRRVPARVAERRSHVVDDGPPQVTFAWPRRDGAGVDLVRALLRRSSLVSQWLDRDGRAQQVEHDLGPHVVQLSVAPTPGSSLDDAEAAARALMDAMARGALAVDDLRRAERQLELEVLATAATDEGLAIELAESFARRVAWSEHPLSRSELNLSDDAIATATRELVQDAAVVVRRESGPDTRAPAPTLALPDTTVPEGLAFGPSRFAAALRAAPVSPPEPQFLAPNEAFTEHARGAGRVIAVTRSTGMLSLRWIVPVGVADDPWVCDAWRARVDALIEDPVSATATISTRCSATNTVLDVQVAARRRDALWPVLEALLDPSLDVTAARLHLARLPEARRILRSDEDVRSAAFASFAMYGEHGMDHNLPSDADVARAEPSVLQAALARSCRDAADVLVEGPAARTVATELVTRMPAPPEAEARAPTLIRPRAPTTTTVFVLDSPERELAEIHVAQAVDARSPIARVIAQSLGDHPSDVPETLGGQLHGTHVKPATFDAGSIYGPEFVRCEHDRVVGLVAGLLAARRRPPSEPTVDEAHHALDATIRARRRFGMEAASYVWSWAKLGERDVDPAIAEWMALRGLDGATARQTHAAITSAPAIVAVVADVDDLDVAGLADLGTVVHVEPGSLRDPMLDDITLLSDPLAR